jgi:hypothetical protein
MVLFLGVGCSKADSTNSLVVVTVTAPPAMPAVTQLRAFVSNAGSSDTRLFPQVPSATAIQFDTTFAVTFPKSRSGELDIAVDALSFALDSAAQVVAAGSGSVVIVAGGHADVFIHLVLVAVADAGAPDASADHYGGSGADARSADGTGTPDVLQAGTDALQLGGSGGRGGSGGSFLSGGGGAGGAASGGTMTIPVSSGGLANPFSGGATGSTGGIVSSGGVVNSGGIARTGGAASTGGVMGMDGGGVEPCVPAKTITGSGSGNSGNFGTTGAFCFRTADNITGWGCANLTGRTLKVNGVTVTCGTLPLPAKVNGYYYFDASAGGVDYASIDWY